MLRDDDGWWRGPSLADGTDYAFLVDGEGPFPDPRSPRQPHGVHGASRAFDAGGLRVDGRRVGGPRRARRCLLRTPRWHVHSGGHARLPQSTSCRASHRSASSSWNSCRSLPCLARAVGATTACHSSRSTSSTADPRRSSASSTPPTRSGLAVALDVVYNHLGPDGNYLGMYGPYFTEAHHTPWGDAINLDQTACAPRAPLPHRQRAAMVPRLSRRRAAARRGPRVPRRLPHALPRRAERGDCGARRANLAGPCRSSRKATSTTPRWSSPTRATAALGRRRNGPTTSTTRCTPTSRARPKGLYSDFRPIETVDKAYRRCSSTTAAARPSADRDWGNPVPRSPRSAAVRRLRVEPRPGGESCDRDRLSLGSSAPVSRPRPSRSCCCRRSLRCSSRARSTARRGRSCSSPITPSRSAARSRAGASRGIRGPRMGRGRGPARSAGSGDLPRELDRPRRARQATQIRTWLRQRHGRARHTLRPDAWAGIPVSVTESGPRQLTMTGPVVVHANLSAEPVAYEGRPMAVFGSVAVTATGFVLAARRCGPGG